MVAPDAEKGMTLVALGRIGSAGQATPTQESREIHLHADSLTLSPRMTGAQGRRPLAQRRSIFDVDISYIRNVFLRQPIGEFIYTARDCAPECKGEYALSP